MLLNKRTQQVEHHKGEVSFPGGQQDGTDANVLATALREAHEEMGVAPMDVEVLGQLSPVATLTGFHITPFVGVAPDDYPFEPSPAEVAEVLEVPISALMSEGAMGPQEPGARRPAAGGPRYTYEGHQITGATAKMLAELLKAIAETGDEDGLWKRTQP